MGVFEERVVQITSISKGHLFLQALSLFLSHCFQCRFVTLVQLVVKVSKNHDNKAQQPKGYDDSDLSTNVPRSLACLERLCAENVSQSKGNESECIGRDLIKLGQCESQAAFCDAAYLFRVSTDVGRIPCQQKHKSCSEGSSQE